MRNVTITEKLATLQPGEAIHIGHSFLVLNIAGFRIALDPATETGFCTAPFSNFTSTAHSELTFLKPLINPKEIIPPASNLAKYIDIVLYSHLHPDHFNAALLTKIIKANPTIFAVGPAKTLKTLRFRPNQYKSILEWILRLFSKTLIAKDYISGLQEFLNTDAPQELSSANLIELKDGEFKVIRENPLIEIRAFEIRHPKAQFYVRLPFESVELPSVLGYEILYEEACDQKSILLVGESSTDPELLWQIWKNRDRLTAVFIPVADEPTTQGIKWLKDAYHHASLQIIALSERLSSCRTSIHCLHQGLWYYTLDHARIEAGRRIIECQEKESPTSAQEVEKQLANSRKLRDFSIKAILAQISLIKIIGRFPQTSFDKTHLHPVGEVFTYNR